MNRTTRFLGMVMMVIALLGCKKNNVQPIDQDPSGKEMQDLVIGSNFLFKTTRVVQVDVALPFTVDYEKINGKVDFFYLQNETPQVVHSGLADHRGVFSGSFEVPSWLDTIYVHNTAGEIAIPLTSNTKSTQDAIYVNFGGTLDTLPPAMPPAKMKSKPASQPESGLTGHHAPYLNHATSLNLIGNGMFDNNVFGSIQQWYSAMPQDGKWYITSQLSGKAAQYNDGGNMCMRISKPSSTYGGVAQIIPASAGHLITLSGNIKVAQTGTKYAWLYLIPRNSAGAAIEFFAVEASNLSTQWGWYSVMATMPAGTVDCEVLLWMNSWGGYVYFDNIVATGPNPDTDGDGLIDAEDDYPADPARAVDLFYPASGNYGTFAFEDNWPYQADYDFNDLVVGFQFKQVLNAGNQLVELFAKFSVRAIGASYTNAFGFEMNLPPDAISGITGNSITQSYLSFNGNQTEAGQTKAVIMVTDNPFIQLPHPGGGSGVNTTPGAPYVAPDTLTVHVSLANPVSVSTIGLAPYNPFIIVNKTRGREIHFKNQTPTNLMDPSYFGTGSDKSVPANGIYYQSANHLPWAIEMPTAFNHMAEQKKIIEGYLKFASWAESSGSTYSDWYVSTSSGYRNADKIY